MPATACPADQNLLLAAARRLGLVKKAGVAAVHTLLVETPSGQQRTFRWVGEVGWVGVAEVADQIRCAVPACS
jgi:hypothetical protein